MSSLEDFTDWESRQHSFEAMGLFRRESPVFVGASETVRIPGTNTTAGLFRAVGIHPLRGRFTRDADDLPGAPPVAVVSESFAAQRLDGVDRAIGALIRLNGT